MRTDKELIQLTLDNLDELQSGLCALLDGLFLKKIISEEEGNRICFIMSKHRPETNEYSAFWWPAGQIKPRREFLQNILNKL